MNTTIEMKTFLIASILATGTLLAGCTVPQPAGKGISMHRTEPVTGRGYWLYLPEDYVANQGRRADGKKWPLVMTFHGMKPWDNAKPQVREWQEEADRYGYVVCAPELTVCDIMKEFPVKTQGTDLLGDEEAILAIMDDIYHKTEADPEQVLATSWSSGGFVAHYIVNRHPGRFSCLSTRQSNFEESIMSADRFRRYRAMPIGLYYTTNDFGVCKRDTLKAIAWYKTLGASRMESGMVLAMGHERTPEVAADFFARVCGAKPKTPPTKLARIRVNEVPGDALAIAYTPPKTSTSVLQISEPFEVTNYSDGLAPRPVDSPQAGTTTPSSDRQNSATRRDGSPNVINQSAPMTGIQIASRPPTKAAPKSLPVYSSQASPPPRSEAYRPSNKTADRGTTTSQRPNRDNKASRSSRSGMPLYKPANYPPPGRVSGRRASYHQPPPRQSATSPNVPVSVQVSSTIGIAPLLIDYAVTLQRGVERGADVLWADNGVPIGNGLSGQKVLTTAGEHTISVLVITKDDRELRANTKVTVLAPIKRKQRLSR